MMVPTDKPKILIITYDDGEGTETLRVPHFLFNDEEFRNHIISIRCLFCDSSNCAHCNFEENQK